MIFPAVFAHHFLPVLALSAICYFLALAPGNKFRFGRLNLGVVPILIMLATAFAGEQYQNRVGQFHVEEWKEISGEIRQYTKEGEPIFVFPHDSSYYFFSDRKPPGPYGFLLPWTTPEIVTTRVLNDLNANPPKVILYTFLANCTPDNAYPHQYLRPILDRIIEGYRIERIWDNRVVQLLPVDPSAALNHEERCRMEELFYSDLSCHHLTRDQILRFLEKRCGKNQNLI
jgi:hypothetical protein